MKGEAYMAKEDRNIEVTQSISDVFTPIVSGLATLGTGTAYAATAIDHDNNRIAFGSGSSIEEAEQDALDRLEQGDSEEYSG
jgi:hypothetical protein